jgi:hypothetical protein
MAVQPFADRQRSNIGVRFGQAAPSLRSALLRHRQCLSVVRSISREGDTASTISMAFVMATTADEWSTLVANSPSFVVGFKGLLFARVIRARHFPGCCSNTLMRNVLYFIIRPRRFVLRRDAKVGKASRRRRGKFSFYRRLQSDVIGTALSTDHGFAESDRS